MKIKKGIVFVFIITFMLFLIPNITYGASFNCTTCSVCTKNGKNSLCGIFHEMRKNRLSMA